MRTTSRGKAWRGRVMLAYVDENTNQGLLRSKIFFSGHLGSRHTIHRCAVSWSVSVRCSVTASLETRLNETWGNSAVEPGEEGCRG